jgi:hypothetical protein
MSSFDNHVHIDEFAAAATPAEMVELNAWIHGIAPAPVVEVGQDEEVDPSGGCDESDEGCADFADGEDWDYTDADEQFEYDECGPY